MLPCCDVALVLQQRDKSVTSRIYSAILCERRVFSLAAKYKRDEQSDRIINKAKLIVNNGIDIMPLTGFECTCMLLAVYCCTTDEQNGANVQQ